MRNTGKTTRLIDKAIQHLFETGRLKLLSNNEIFSRNGEGMKGMKEEDIFVDHDTGPDNSVQKDFNMRIVDRLTREHAGKFAINKYTKNIVLI